MAQSVDDWRNAAPHFLNGLSGPTAALRLVLNLRSSI